MTEMICNFDRDIRPRPGARSAASARRRAGTAMSETVLVLPLLLIILSLLFYLGHMGVRVQRARGMARYETWRQVDHSPGPHWDPWRDVMYIGDSEQLNGLYFGHQAESIEYTVNDRYFPRHTLDELVALANGYSADAAMCAEWLLFREPDGYVRRPRGHREGFVVRHTTDVPLWEYVDGPIRRRSERIGRDWRYTNDWRAGADVWIRGTGRGRRQDTPRGVRDAFYLAFDAELDAIDGQTDPEYSDYPDGPQHPPSDQLAGLIRRMYLVNPSYRGPIVDDELP